MKMNVTEAGIDWDRVAPEDFEKLYAFAMEAGEFPTSCRGRHYGLSYAGHFTTADGRNYCELQAIDALYTATKGRNLDIARALRNALGTTRKEVFAAHVRTD